MILTSLNSSRQENGDAEAPSQLLHDLERTKTQQSQPHKVHLPHRPHHEAIAAPCRQSKDLSDAAR